jgi:hypothetical protein
MTREFLRLLDIAHSKWKTLPRDQFLQDLYRLQSDTCTCLVEIRQTRDRRNGLMALLVGGQVVNLYRAGDYFERLNHSDLSTALPGRSSSLRMRVLALTPNMARLVKILLEQPGVETSVRVRTEHLGQVVKQAGQSSWPILAHVSWVSAQGFLLMPGRGMPEQHTLFVVPSQLSHSGGGLVSLYQWYEPFCRVRMYYSDTSTLAWQEYFLHYSFHSLMKYLFARIESLSGRWLLGEIIRDLNFTTSANGWNINISISDVSDQAVFSSPQQARHVYQRLLEIFIRHASPMVGERMTDVLLRETWSGLCTPYGMLDMPLDVYSPAD